MDIRRWSRYIPTSDKKDPGLVQYRLFLDRVQPFEFLWEPYLTPEVNMIAHPAIFKHPHVRLWTTRVPLIYYGTIEGGRGRGAGRDGVDTGGGDQAGPFYIEGILRPSTDQVPPPLPVDLNEPASDPFGDFSFALVALLHQHSLMCPRSWTMIFQPRRATMSGPWSLAGATESHIVGVVRPHLLRRLGSTSSMFALIRTLLGHPSLACLILGSEIRVGPP
ncbi:hypothetical protein PIB30_101435 [Stylosanthes scabra]|uniref:Aminotransferase-like plant mobile domain-containing protein n=1 Tax=Stylosanthes scabra TaxID=79078 RepID=A0ABU6ZW38_9FABA|nr:hypothetical protein [Stylosanthes scabra]